MTNLKNISDQVARMLPLVGSDDLIPALVALLREWALIDEVSMIAYPPVESPRIVYRENSQGRLGLEDFLTGPFLLDPYYVTAVRRGEHGFFSLKQLAPTGFKSSEYYRIYYRFNGVLDECGYIIALGEGGFLNLALERNQGSRPFDRASLTRLRDLAPLVSALLVSHFESASQHQGLDEPGPGLRAELENALTNFGHDVLTPREQQTINAILHGHTSKAQAHELGISIETVKLHRKNAYRKLAVRNQTELFHMFIESLKGQCL